MPKKNREIEILQCENPILREVSSILPLEKIKDLKTKELIIKLKKAIESQSDAAAISAIQIGEPVRLFVVSKKVFDLGDEENKKVVNDLVCINPKILKSSKKKQSLEEGCLSVRYVYGKVSRPEKVTIEFYDETGKKIIRGFSGLLAQIVQHENDHLDGILFTDKATDIYKISKEEYEDMIKNIDK